MILEYPIDLLEKEKRKLEKYIKKNDLMKADLHRAGKELRKISQLTQAIKQLKKKTI